MKILIAILLLLFLLLQYNLWLGDGGIPEVLKFQKEIEIIETEVKSLEERNNTLEAEVNDLKQGLDAIEERARSELGMIGKDEIYYQVIDSDE